MRPRARTRSPRRSRRATRPRRRSSRRRRRRPSKRSPNAPTSRCPRTTPSRPPRRRRRCPRAWARRTATWAVRARARLRLRSWRTTPSRRAARSPRARPARRSSGHGGFVQFGDYRVEVVPGGEFRLDGGAMFGVVPRALWQRVAPPDDENRVTLNANCLFVEAAGERVLVETGMGDKWSPRQREMYGVSPGPTLREALYERTGCRPEDVSVVVNTHL